MLGAEEPTADTPRPVAATAIAAIVGLLWGLAMDGASILLIAWGMRRDVHVRGPADHVFMLSIVLLMLAISVAWLFRVVLFLAWLHRAVRVVLAIGTIRPSITPRDAVLCWFIPVVGLIRPYTVVRSVCRASLPRGERTRDWLAREPSILPLWWATLLGASIFGWLALDVEHVGPLTAVWFIAQAIASACAVVIVWSVHKRQERLFAEASPPARAFEPPEQYRDDDEIEDEDEHEDDDEDA